MDKKSLAVVAVVGIVALAAGYAIGMIQGKNSVMDEVNGFFPSRSDVRSISGTVKSVSGDTITVEMETKNIGSPFENIPPVREVIVGSNTKITKSERLDSAEFRNVQETYRNLGYSVLAPVRQVEVKVTDIKAGDRLNITADQDIKMEEKFAAVTITISPIVPASATPAPK